MDSHFRQPGAAPVHRHHRQTGCLRRISIRIRCYTRTWEQLTASTSETRTVATISSAWARVEGAMARENGLKGDDVCASSRQENVG